MKAYDPIIGALVSKLTADESISSWEGWSDKNDLDIFPAYISFVKNQRYPCITIFRDYGNTIPNGTGFQTLHYYVHGWFQTDASDDQNMSDDAAFLMNMVIHALDDSETNHISEFAMCRMVDSSCPLYDESTRTTYFMTMWKIKASKNLIY